VIHYNISISEERKEFRTGNISLPKSGKRRK
jgi:hypothetical protein